MHIVKFTVYTVKYAQCGVHIVQCTCITRMNPTIYMINPPKFIM